MHVMIASAVMVGCRCGAEDLSSSVNRRPKLTIDQHPSETTLW